VLFDTDFTQIYHPRRMGQRLARPIAQKFFAIAIGLLASAGCDRGQSSHRRSKTSSPTVASLVPAATDLIIAMGATDQLVAISNYDQLRPQIQFLPRVGDYLTNDWEKLSEIRPEVMVTQFDPAREPPGLAQRAKDLGIELVNVKIDRVDDIFTTIDQLGGALNVRKKAEKISQSIRDQIDRVKRRVAERPAVRTLIVLDDEGQFVAGPGTYLDELLTIAGGENVLRGTSNSYPRIDRELLLSLAPQAVIQLQPDATIQRIDQAKQTWESLPQLPAVKNGRVYRLRDWWVMLPASEVGQLAERFADALHPESIPAPGQSLHLDPLPAGEREKSR
jgi:iron complex transport system substrate-binding protein